MSLNRMAAMNYAQRYWSRPCDDNYIVTGDGRHSKHLSIVQKRIELNAPAVEGWEAVFIPYQFDQQNPQSLAEEAVFQRTANGVTERKVIQEWAGLLDCAHYLRRCMSAEGIKVSDAIDSVGGLVMALQSRQDTKILAEKVAKNQGQRVVDSGILKKGDMIGYFNVDPHDWNPNHYGHSGMYVGKDYDPAGGMTSHTYCRLSGATFNGFTFGDHWYLHDGFLYTLIHFSDDDQPLAGPMITALPGWWKIEAGGTTAYYHVNRSGTAEYSSTAPRSEFDQPPHGHDSACYFRDGTKIIFIWRQTGNVAVWTAGGDRNQFNVTLNDASGQATKVPFAHHGGHH